jgi:selenocysteine-specific elongation factor
MNTLLVGVLGHVDHGKTALVRALTGLETDRLKEEKARGISIALGFAHLAIAGGMVDLVDMPGHERFVRTMVAGATGIETALLVVAANEGVKPQTVEHVEIAGLLGVREAAVVVTKGDLVDKAAQRAVAEAASSLLARNGVTVAARITTSALTGEGIAALAEALAALARAAPPRLEHGFFHLPVDRVFTVAGFGTVATGTLRRGRLAVGDAAEIVPGGARARVRRMQVHGHDVDGVEPARRVAVNLRGIDREALAPGGALATPGIIAVSEWLDVELRLLAGAPSALATGAALRLLFGTTELGIRLRLLDRDALEPGETAIAQLRCERPVALPGREPFILRTPSPPMTIGGGRVLEPVSQRRRRFDGAALAGLRRRAENHLETLVVQEIAQAGEDGARLAEVARAAGVAPVLAHSWAKRSGAEVLGDGTVLARAAADALASRVVARLAGFHEAQPEAPGLSRERLVEALPASLSRSAAAELLAKLVDAGRVAVERGVLRLAAFAAPRLPPLTGPIEEIEAAFRDGGLMPAAPCTILGHDPSRHRAARELVRRGVLVRAVDRVQKREFLFHRSAVVLARAMLARAFSNRSGFTMSEAARALGVTRKFGVPLLELLDALHVTRRNGDLRVLVARRQTAAPAGRTAAPT